MQAGAFIIKNGMAIGLRDYASLFISHGFRIARGPNGKLYTYSSVKLPNRTHKTECLIRIDHLKIAAILNLLGY